MMSGLPDYVSSVCGKCGHTVLVTVEHGGRHAKCPKCDGIIHFPKTETSIRLRSDLELTQEARAKAGRTGPESDPEIPSRRPNRTAAVRARRPASRRPSGSKSALLVVIIVAVAAVIGLALILG